MNFDDELNKYAIISEGGFFWPSNPWLRNNTEEVYTSVLATYYNMTGICTANHFCERTITLTYGEVEVPYTIIAGTKEKPEDKCEEKGNLKIKAFYGGLHYRSGSSNYNCFKRLHIVYHTTITHCPKVKMNEEKMSQFRFHFQRLLILYSMPKKFLKNMFFI